MNESTTEVGVPEGKVLPTARWPAPAAT